MEGRSAKTCEISNSLSAYGAELLKTRHRNVPGDNNTLWVRSESVAMIRFPTFYLGSPSPQELGRVLWNGPAAVLSYVRNADGKHSQNTLLYLSEDSSYDLEKLSKPARRDARRALRSLSIGFADWPTLLNKGTAAFNDTCLRIGVTQRAPVGLRQRYEHFSKNPYHRVVAAWKDDELAGFMTLIVVEDWVEIEGSYFSDAHRGLCPSNGLAHYVLDHFLVQRKFHAVSYGMSSVQEADSKAGLHAYKTKVGFEAKPAHRVFALHPVLQPFINRFTRGGVNTALRILPGNRQLRKAEGVLASLLGENRGLRC